MVNSPVASHESAMSITVKDTLNYYILILVVGASVSVASVVETSITTLYKLVCTWQHSKPLFYSARQLSELGAHCIFIIVIYIFKIYHAWIS